MCVCLCVCVCVCKCLQVFLGNCVTCADLRDRFAPRTDYSFFHHLSNSPSRVTIFITFSFLVLMCVPHVLLPPPKHPFLLLSFSLLSSSTAHHVSSHLAIRVQDGSVGASTILDHSHQRCQLWHVLLYWCAWVQGAGGI